jgi:calcineurin-like phosphoesterase family protein
METMLSTKKQNVFFTSDTHFYHANIMRFCDRPFETVELMNEYMIKKWNEVVKPEDYIFHLGDFAWGGSALWNDLLDRLNGKKILIIGNHDRKNLRQGYMGKFLSVEFEMMINVNGQPIYLNHLPFLCYDGSSHRDILTWNLHGHVHTSLYHNGGFDFERIRDYSFPTQYDVGVDLNNFRPISFDELKVRMDYQIKNNCNCTHWIDENNREI